MASASQASSVSMSEAALISGLERVIPGYVRESNPNLVNQLKDEILGNYVVIDKAEIVKKTFQTVSLKFPGVKRGDLITADLMNQIIQAIENLDERVTALESAEDDTVVITSISPSGNLRIGQELRVFGRNFGLTIGTCRVKVEGVQVNAFKTGSNDQLLIFNIPNVPNVPLAGKSVALIVSNRTSSDSRSFTLLPFQPLQGLIEVTWVNVEPRTFTPGNPGTFRFRLKSRTNLDATYTINPVISVSVNSQVWQERVEVLDNEMNVISSRMIALETGQERIFHVRINPIPDVADDTQFTLTVNASADSVTGTSGPIDVTLGTAIELPNPNISLSFEKAEFSPANSGSIETGPEGNTIHLNPTSTAQITLLAEFRAVGNYQVLIAPWSNETENWNLRRHPQSGSSFTITSAMLDNEQEKHDELPRFLITPRNGASSTGEVEFKISDPETVTSRTLRMKLALNS
jgi:hypothetical protein